MNLFKNILSNTLIFAHNKLITGDKTVLWFFSYKFLIPRKLLLIGTIIYLKIKKKLILKLYISANKYYIAKNKINISQINVLIKNSDLNLIIKFYYLNISFCMKLKNKI